MILLMLILALSLGIIPINHPTIHTTVALVGVYVFRLGVIIAGGFFMALFLGMLVQEYRIAAERARWTELLDQRLQEATGLLEEQLRELRFYNDIASRLSGELRVEGVLEILLQVFL